MGKIGLNSDLKNLSDNDLLNKYVRSSTRMSAQCLTTAGVMESGPGFLFTSRESKPRIRHLVHYDKRLKRRCNSNFKELFY